MMCRIANGGCGTEDTHCPVSTSRVPKPEDKHAPLSQIGINFYAQACKALAVVSPFDLEDVQKKSSATVTTLPSGLASCLFKQFDNRKKHKKSHSATDTKKNKEKVQVNSIWSQTEDHFRRVCFDDIEKLNVASFFRANSLVSIPYPGNKNSNNIACMLPQSSSGIEWLLGSRSKKYLTSELPSKKRKLAGRDDDDDDVEMRAFCLKHSESQKEGSASSEDGTLNTSSNVKSKTDFVDVADVKVSDSSNLTLLLKKKNLKLKVLSAHDNNVGRFSFKLGPPRKKVKGNIRVLMDNSLILSLKRSSAQESSPDSRTSTESCPVSDLLVGNIPEQKVDEVEGELVYYQHQLLCNAVARKQINDVLISKIAKCLPREIEDLREHNWDSVFVRQFLSDLKRVKKQGQKERRKDTVDGSAHQENILKPKEAHSHSRVCDVCRRADIVLNPVIMCSSCKVSVHIDCYRSIKDSRGPWFCELCEDIWSSDVAECRLCGGTTGAFRKSTDGQWVHAFCAEWILESTFRRGQVEPIDCMDTVFKGNDTCLVCSRKEGACLKCNYGHCQRTFHPTCGRSACLFMNVRTIGGKLQHKAYCDKHSLVESTKAETQKYGVEEWNSLKKVRVELERLRLICERVIKREKSKRELVICSHDTLRWNRESIISSFTRLCTAYVSPDVSSESATTSLKGGYTNSYKSCSETIQRLDDVTIDSSVTGKRRIRFSMAMDADQKTDDSSTSQIFTHVPTVRPLAGKQIPHRPSRTPSDDVDKFPQHGKHTETFEKELVMTSDQASMRNQQLPKGFVYVPIRCLSNEEEIIV